MLHIIRVRGFVPNVINGRAGGVIALRRLDDVVAFHNLPFWKNARRRIRSSPWRNDPPLWSSTTESPDRNADESGAGVWSSIEDDTENAKDYASRKEETWLVVGDGDFSFSTQLAQDLSSHANGNNIRLLASVLESEDRHARIYQDSKANVQLLREVTPSVRPRFEIDATRLEHSFPAHSIDRIQFNFPHWRGKSNHRYNRQLLHDFFASCSTVLSRHGTSQIRVALCHGQGGNDATTLKEWKESWRIAALAAEHGFLLRRTEPFVVRYNVSSHRGVDRAFPVGAQPLLYTFGGPSETPVPVHLQMAHRFELRILLKPAVLARWGDDLLHVAAKGLALLEKTIIPQVLPRGIRCEMPMHNMVLGEGNDDVAATHESKRKYPLLVILVVLVGERSPLSRTNANTFRMQLEEAVEAYFGGDQVILHKGDRQVSKAFPYHLLSALIQERSNAGNDK